MNSDGSPIAHFLNFSLTKPPFHLHNHLPILFIMASRSFSKVLRSPLTRQIVSPAVQRRTIVSALGGVRATVAKAATAPVQQVRGVKTVDFAGHKEKVFGMCIAD